MKDIRDNKVKRVYDMAKGFTRKIKYDYVSSFAGHGALFFMMSLFPMMLYLISLTKYLPFDAKNLIELSIQRYMPGSIAIFLETLIQEAYLESSIMTKSVTVIITLICASKGVYAMMIGLNAVYGIRETLNFVILYAIAVLYVVAFFGVIILLMGVIVFGNTIFLMIAQYIPTLHTLKQLVSPARYGIVLVILQIFLMTIYIKIPNRKSKVKQEAAGAFFSSIAILIFSGLFSVYIEKYANYDYMYGSLATIIIAIFWLYIVMYIIFIGAELNVVSHKYIEVGHSVRKAYEYFDAEYEGDLRGKEENFILEFMKDYLKRNKK